MLVATLAPTSGCGLQTAGHHRPGEVRDYSLRTTVSSLGEAIEYRLSLPHNYSPSTPGPLLMHHHGWGESRSSPSGSEFHHHGKVSGYAVVSISGYRDGKWWNRRSWNGAGSTQSPRSALGATCLPQTQDFCYSDSCGACADNCWWTTCQDSVAQTLAVLAEVVGGHCIDEDRVFSTGISNGGAYQFELGYDARSSGKFAGIFPIIGSPHAGFVRGLPAGPVPLLAVWGHSDTTMPPCYNGPGSQGEVDAHTGSADTALDTAYTGHFYSTARNATSAWAAAAGCTVAPSYDPCNGVLRNASEGHNFYPVASDTIHCVQWSGCEMGVEVIECIDTRAGHWSPSNWHDEIWAFMQRSIRPGSSRNGPG
mmetsp:Transcript_881/g.2628  ORF Transcript_881/g.2628 Transcript_881/m.2628 type:complete len:366 (-) Transcript_881:160-1257(-)